MTQTRQLAAIMFTDIVGYTAMMEEDEMAAMNCRQKLKQKLEEVVAEHQGRIIEFRGDGGMCSFTSTIQCVKAGLTLQLDMQTSPVVPLRIGMHTGDVIFEGNNIYGDGVNIASRMESFAIPGSIFISAKVYDDIKNQKDIQTISLGKYALKNVKEQVEIFAVSNPGIIVPGNNSLEGKGEKVPEKKITDKSIAVLPFVNMSNDPEQEYFSDGMAEEIINSLVHIKDLNIAGRTSSASFKGKNIDLKEVGKKLGVGTVLEGSIRKQGSRIRITAQLINVEDGFHLWSEKYDRNLDDIFAIQDEIALAITEKLKIALLEKDRKQLVKSFTQNTEAYEYYLKGRFHINRRGSFILTGLQFFKQAIEADPEYALAYAGYADASILCATYSFFPGKDILNEVKNAAEKAISLDRALGEGYCSIGMYYAHLEWNWEEARKNFIKAIELNPKYVQAYSWYGMAYLAWVEGKFDEAEKYGRMAIKLEPLSAIDHGDLAWTLYTAQRFEESLVVAKTGIELDANSFLSHRFAGLCYMALKRNGEAIVSFKNLVSISDGHQHAVNNLIWAYCADGRMKEAMELMNELEERSLTEYIAGAYFGISAAWTGDIEKAFLLLEKAFKDKDPILHSLKYEHNIPELLRNDPRYQDMLERIGFPK